MSCKLPRQVDDFRSAALHGDPLLYPGERPDASYMTDGNEVVSLVHDPAAPLLRMNVLEKDSVVSLDEYLAAKNAPGVSERVAVLAFGANMCPGSLKSKFTKGERPDLQIVPTVYTSLPGYDVVWSGGPGINGNFIANLYRGPETSDTTVQVGFNLLTREQLLVMHATELNYDLAPMEATIGGTAVRGYYYAGKDSVYTEDEKPVAIQSVLAEGRSIAEASNREMLSRMLGNKTLRTMMSDEAPGIPAEIESPEEYIQYVKSLRKKPGQPSDKMSLKKRIHQILSEQGLSKVSDTSPADVESWANPSTLRTVWDDGQAAGPVVHTLPTSELAISQWPTKGRSIVLKNIVEHFYRHSSLTETTGTA